MRAEIVIDRARLASLRPAWWDLLERLPEAPPFVTPAWLLPWWDVFAPGRLFTIAVWEADRLVGLAPLYEEHGPCGRRLLPLGIGLSDAMDVLLDPGRQEDAGAIIGLALAEGRQRWDCWSAEEIPENGAILRLADPPGWTSSETPQSACPVLPLAGQAPEPAIPARRLRKWRMAQNRTARRAWSLDLTQPSTLGQDLDALFRLHAARWQSRGEAGVLADDAVRRFHEAAAPELLAAGLLRMAVLRIEGAIAGVYHGLHRGSTAYAYLGGFDPAFAFESPGTVLIGAAIERAGAEGARCFSFLRGQEAYKYEWGAVDCTTTRRTFEPIGCGAA